MCFFFFLETHFCRGQVTNQLFCFLLSLSSPFFSPSLLFPILIPLLFSSHSLTYLIFCPIFSLLMPVPLPLTSSLCQTQYVGSLISWGNRRKSTHSFIIHTFSSSPAICPSTTSDPASKSNCPSATTWTNRRTAHKHKVCVSLSQPGVSSLLFSPYVFCLSLAVPLLSQ